MKKYFASIFLVLVVIICSISMAGCNNGFELVKSVSITTNGEIKTFSSSTGPSFSFSSQIEITSEEYNNAPKDRVSYGGSSKLKDLSKITINDAIRAAKNSTHYEMAEEELQGYWYHSNFDFYGSQKYYYFKSKYEKTYFNFVYAKVKNDTTITIKKGDTETTYTVTSYNIVKF